MERSAVQRSPLGQLLFSNYCHWEHSPSLCHLDRSVPGFPTSHCQRRPLVRLSVKRAACRSSKPRVSTGNPGQRSGGTCGSAALSWKCFSCRGVMGLRPTQGDEKRLLFSNYLPWKHRPPICHLDRSAPGFPTSRCWQRPRVRLSVERAACRPSTPRVFIGNPGERSGEICGNGPFLEMFFDRA